MNKSIESNKATVRSLLSTIEAGGDFSVLLTANATWWVPEGCALSGSYSVAQLLAAMSQVFGVYKSPPKFTVEHVTAEDNRVAVFCHSTAELTDGSAANNRYHFLFILENGLICEVKEFMNTAVVNQIMTKVKQITQA